MPIEIFGDYISDTLGEEFSWEYLVFAINGFGHSRLRDTEQGNGDHFFYTEENQLATGCGNNQDEGYGYNDYFMHSGYGFGHVASFYRRT